MRVIVVDDNEAFARQLSSALTWAEEDEGAAFEILSIDAAESAFDVAQLLHETLSRLKRKEDAIVLININLRLRANRRETQAGVAVLKYLRLNRDFDSRAREVHCCMYSFHNLEQLLRRRPESLIVCSAGTTFHQLPFPPNPQLLIQSLQGLATCTAECEAGGLAPFVRVGFSLPDERHSFANWWAARQMYQISRLSSGGKPDRETVEAQPVSNPEFRDALYLYDETAVVKRGMLRYEANLVSARSRIRDMLTGEKSIGLIDDQASLVGSPGGLGWRTVYAEMLGVPHPKVTDLIEACGMSRQAIDVTTLCSRLSEKSAGDYVCILLDLRLTPADADREVANSSGAIILRALRKARPTLPVIMSTASNKLTSFEEVIKLGADAYWVKQGIDERRTLRETVANYVRLVELVMRAAGSEYQFLHRVGKTVDALKSCESTWWENAEWRTIVRVVPERNVIVALLEDALLHMRAYLHRTIMGYGYEAHPDRRFTVWSVVQHLGKAVEEIHRVDQLADDSLMCMTGTYEFKDGTKGLPRHDYFGRKLHDIRNAASHRYPRRLESLWNRTDLWPMLAEYVANVMTYLTRERLREGKPGEGFDGLRAMREGSPAHEKYYDWLLHGDGG